MATCRKDPLGCDVNEDCASFDEVRGTLALCDGASESYDSSVWAQILADKFVSDPAITPGWLDAAVSDYVSRHDLTDMSWSRLASYERGTFATLLGVQFLRENQTVEVLAVGDSLVVLVDGGAQVRSWPYNDPARFQERPTLFCTRPEHNKFFTDAGFWSTHGTHFDLGQLNSPRLVCVTDALGEWLLRQTQSGGNGLERLLALTSDVELQQLVVAERLAGRMRVDDSTLMIVGFETEESNGVSHI